MNNKFKLPKNPYKKFFQYGILAILAVLAVKTIFNIGAKPDFEAYCPLGGLQALGSYLVKGSLACSMTGTQIVMGIILAIVVMLFGKLFCAYICPIGTVSEWLGNIGEKLKIRFTIRGVADLLLRSLKYAILFITFYYTLKSSELFCKMFDPYYALASGFNPDVSVVLSLISIFIVLIGSIFVRLFWCKYLCPLGALSNIFKFYWMFIGVLVIYIILLKIGLDLSYVYPLTVVCVLGFALELMQLQKVKFTPVNVVRNTNTCINCNLCSKKCPQGIDVANMVKVNHVDCNLCGDCLHVCPEKNTLGIIKKENKWLPAAILVVAITLGLILANTWEIPTINEKWGTPEQLKEATTYSQSGMKNIKCYGSSKAFASKLKRIKGVYGVSTYVKNKGVKILYNPNVISEEKLQEKIFSPVKKQIDPLPDGAQWVKEYVFSVDKLFDPIDAFYLEQLLVQNTGACGYYTEYGCPVIVHIFFPVEDAIRIEELVELIESKSMTYSRGGNKPKTVKLGFKVIDKPEHENRISSLNYLTNMYNAVEATFNNYKNFSSEILKELKFPLKGTYSNQRQLSYLISHLSNNNGVVGFKTYLDSTTAEYATVTYVDTMTVLNDISVSINVDSLTITYRNGKKAKVENPFFLNNHK